MCRCKKSQLGRLKTGLTGKKWTFCRLGELLSGVCLERAVPIAGKYWGLAAAGAQISDRDVYWLGLHLLGFVNYAPIHCELLDLPVSVLTRTPKPSALVRPNLLGTCLFIHPLRQALAPSGHPRQSALRASAPSRAAIFALSRYVKALFSPPQGFTHDFQL